MTIALTSRTEIKLTPTQKARITRASKATGKTPQAITRAAVNLYLEELEDYMDVMKRKNERTITHEQLGKELGLET